MTERQKTVATPILRDTGTIFQETLVCTHCHRRIEKVGPPHNYIHEDGKVECHD